MANVTITHSAKKTGSVSPTDVSVTPEQIIVTASKENGEASASQSDSFWVQKDIDSSRWDKLYPYQLVICQAEEKDGEITHRIPPDGKVFTLPIPPESMSVSMPFAISTTATLGGIVEEHNGAPFRMINIHGSTGVLPRRGAAAQQNTRNVGQALLGGTINAASRLATDTLSAFRNAVGELPENTNLHSPSEFDKDSADSGFSIGKSTGYYQFRQLQRFFEDYAALKKTHHGRNYRLAFAIWKDQAVYLVTPQVFNVSKNAGSPLEYIYDISFKAYRRIELGAGGTPDRVSTKISRNPSKVANILNTLRSARNAVESAQNLVGALLGDINSITEPLRQGILLANDLLGLDLTVKDLPEQIKIDINRQMDWSKTKIAQITRTALITDDRKKLNMSRANDPAVLQRNTYRGKVSGVQQGVTSTPPDFTKSGGGAEDMELSSLRLDNTIRKQIADDLQAALSRTRKDLETQRDDFRRQIDALASALGAGSDTYNDTYGITPLIVRRTAPSESDTTLLNELNNAAIAMDTLAATSTDESSSTEARIQAMAGLARGSGTAFRIPTSKFAVPFPYGSTLEGLAQQYLGDVSRWHEIATLNGLREPYVDEIGFNVDIVVNGSGNEVVVRKSSQFYIGQTIYIWSDGVRRTRRTVDSLRDVMENTIITVSGDGDMNRYTLVQRGRVSAFLPDTVNSQSLIYIPSDVDPKEDDYITKSIPGVDEFDPMVAVGGVDFLLDNNNNLVVTPNGDIPWAVGLTNIIQSLRVELSVTQGQLLHHPGFGLPLKVGNSTADVSPTEVLDAVRKMVTNNPSVSRVDAIRIQKNGPVASIDASIVVRGTDRPVPIRYGVRGDYQKS